jgi:hypothetical protein
MTAFVPGPRCNVAGATDGPLAGLRFAVKDLIDIAGVPTGGGNPDWPRIYPTPSKNAWVVQRTGPFAGCGRAGGGMRKRTTAMRWSQCVPYGLDTPKFCALTNPASCHPRRIVQVHQCLVMASVLHG